MEVEGSRLSHKTIKAIIVQGKTEKWTNLSWLVVDLPLWKMMEFVNWDDDIPNIWKVIKAMFQSTNQSQYHSFLPLGNQTWDIFPWSHEKTFTFTDVQLLCLSAEGYVIIIQSQSMKFQSLMSIFWYFPRNIKHPKNHNHEPQKIDSTYPGWGRD